MHYNLKKLFQPLSSAFRQRGAALILMAFILGLAVAAYTIRTFNTASLQSQQDEKTFQTLAEAKATLVGWAVSHRYTPGQMPWPDRKEAVSPNYDGSSDCVTTVFQYSYLLGQLPSLPATSPCLDPNTGLVAYAGLSTYPGLGQEFRDAQGNRLWYAVSRNLVYDYENSENPIINPGMINTPHAITPYLRQGGTESYPWLQVLDRNGNLISDRVAVVLIAPGAPIGGQDRSGVANPNQFLDSFQIGAANFSNSDYAIADEDFIMGDDSRNVSASDTTFVRPYNFNDKLVYITIDELMDALSQRAAAEAKAQLKNYKTAKGYYPYASVIGLTEYYQKNNQLYGFLPIQTPTQPSTTCTVTYTSANASSSTCAFSAITNVEFTRTSSTFTGTTGTGCSRTNSNKTCGCAVTSGSSRCNGAGGVRFTCTTSGCSTSGNLPGKYVFNGVFKFATGSPTSVKANTYSGVCIGCGTAVATCSSPGAASGSFSYNYSSTSAAFNSAATGSTLSPWFTTNKWQDYLFYTISSNCSYAQACTSPDITVGGKPSVQALIVATGKPIISPPYAVKGSAQSHHSSCSANDYLDSTENTDLDPIFESTTKAHGNSFNDQSVIVAP